MKPKFKAVLDMCMENGLKLGMSRAYKHDDNPSQEFIIQKQYDAIVEQLYEWFDLDEQSD